ncbi:hypothetical protein AB0M92_37960 [Streptomyces sp. NPDC051582]|uniref:hypothetical protein n=1 Tax=Streptomyces sp. NPDC051582 TaxID=3155167 RepID=UPI00342439FD
MAHDHDHDHDDGDGEGRWTMTATKKVEYEIVVTSDVFDPANPELGVIPGHGEQAGTRLVVLDETVDALHSRRVRRYFAGNETPVEYLVRTMRHRGRDRAGLGTHGAAAARPAGVARGSVRVPQTVG